MQLDSVKIRNISIFILNDHTIMFMNSLQHPKKKVRLNRILNQIWNGSINR